jgi:hypothetical protein
MIAVSTRVGQARNNDMTTKMRAKVKISCITPPIPQPGDTQRLTMRAVHASNYPSDGSDENNTFAKFTPSLDLEISITNPELVGKFNLNDEFYLDFTPCG